MGVGGWEVGGTSLEFLPQVSGLGQCLAAEGQGVAPDAGDRERPSCSGLDVSSVTQAYQKEWFK